MTKDEIKELFLLRGAELCGIASIDRFTDAPEGIWQIHCHRCRDVCPYNLGSKNTAMKR